MTPTLPDDAAAWARAWRERLNDSAEFADAADGFEATVRCTVQSDDSYRGGPVHLRVAVADGECVAASVAEDADYDYALRGPYGAWKSLLRAELDASSAVMGGPFDVEGNTLALVSNRDVFTELVRAARGVDVEFAH